MQEMLIPCIVYWNFYDMQVHFQFFFLAYAFQGYIACIFEIKTTPDTMKDTLFLI